MINYNHVIDANTNLFTDSIGWTKFSIVYKADGSENFFYLGNFYANNGTNAIYGNDNGQLNYAYYYIDDLTVYELDSTVSVGENIIDNIKIYPNTAQDYFVVDAGKLTAVQVELFDISGRRLLHQKISTNQEQVYVSGLASGVYICLVSSGSQVVKRQKLIIQK